MCFTPPSAWRDKSYPLVPFLEPATPRDAGAVLLMTLIVEEGGPRSARCSFCESLGQASPTTTTTPTPGTRMVAPQAAGAPCMAALLMPLVMLSSPWAQGRDTPAVHVYQRRSDCYESNGTHRFLERYVYNRDVFVQFDSTVGVFVAVTELGRWTARNWNIQREFLELRRGAVDAVCRHNYELDRAFTLERRVQPKVNVSPSKKGPLQHPDLLVCHVTDFYPGHVQVRWFLNGQEETAGVVSTNLIHNGDWTFQILVMLEMTPQQGDVYTCHVEHPSLDSAVTVEWKAQSDSARSKMLTGVGGFVLGLLTLTVSVTLHFRGQRGLRS